MHEGIFTVCTTCHAQTKDYDIEDQVVYVDHCDDCASRYLLAHTSLFAWMYWFGQALVGEAGHLALILRVDANFPCLHRTESEAVDFCLARGWPTAGLSDAFSSWQTWKQHHPAGSP